MIKLAPSILSADFSRLGEEIRAVQTAGADWLHVDVMDGHFVPNLTLGPPIIKALRPITSLPFDVHLMIEAPERSIDAYVEAGANHVIVHAEACTHLHRTLEHLRQSGVRAGVSLNPATPLAHIQHVLPLLDVVLVMTVNPGFGGQKFIRDMLPKVRDLATLKSRAGLDFDIEVDGGISNDTIGEVARAGANVFVAGSAVFGTNDYTATLRAMRQAAA
jgi:ribulose-phosphate 3-epimerase